jgi:hypothetical protein
VLVTSAAPIVRNLVVVLVCRACRGSDSRDADSLAADPPPEYSFEYDAILIEQDEDDDGAEPAIGPTVETASRSSDGNIVHGTGSATASGSIQVTTKRRSGRS